MTRTAATAPKTILAIAASVSAKRIGDTLRLWAERRQSRAALARLEPHLLRDIGLDGENAGAESARPFWL